MAEMIISIGDDERRVSFDIGYTIREILDTTNLRTNSLCLGNGSCGQCLVKIEQGNVSEPTPNELYSLTTEQLYNGIRLSCQAKPLEDVYLSIINPFTKTSWKSIPAGDLLYNGVEDPIEGVENNGCAKRYGVAVDLGTTSVSLSIWDLNRKKRVATRNGLNKQYYFGSDVISRLVAASESEEKAGELSKLARESILEALVDISRREYLDLKKVEKMIIVGNTAMLALLVEKNSKLMLKPEYWLSEIECQPDNISAWSDYFSISPEAEINVIQPLFGFVGSDLLASVVATGLLEEKEKSLLIDFGTNSEIALWDSKKLWVTSAAGGPAFEGCGISCGMPAITGAIYKVSCDDKDYKFEVIDDSDIEGLCGSGLVDIIACATKNDILNARGKFNKEGKNPFVINEKPEIKLNEKDVDIFQRAKAAVATGVATLLRESDFSINDISSIYICGTFGRNLQIDNAQSIGLIPECNGDKITTNGNSALSGCERLLMDSKLCLDDIFRDNIQKINLSTYREFDKLFLENLFLKPMRE